MMKTVEPQQPGYLLHSEAVAAPMDRLTQRKALVVGHRPQSLPSAPLRVPDESIAFAERGQHRDGHRPSSRRSRSARSLRRTARASNAERCAACLTDC
jgi:hypothetical protein